MRNYFKNSARAFAALGAFGATAAMTLPAHAISPKQETVSVKIDSRDLVTDRGVEQVYQTLARKAENACVTPGIKPISDRVAEKTCTKELLREFIQDVDSAKLTSYHEAQKASA